MDPHAEARAADDLTRGSIRVGADEGSEREGVCASRPLGASLEFREGRPRPRAECAAGHPAGDGYSDSDSDGYSDGYSDSDSDSGESDTVCSDCGHSDPGDTDRGWSEARQYG